jgi:hypothetical protein
MDTKERLAEMSAAAGRRRGEVFDEDKWVKAMDGRKFVSSSTGYI